MLLLNKKYICIILLSTMFVDAFSLQFGNGNDESSTVFIQVAENVKDFFLHTRDSFIIKEDNTLWGTGQEVNWKFNGTDDYINTFEKLESDVLSFDGVYLIKKDGSTYEVYKGMSKFPYDILKGSGPFFIKKDNSLWVAGENDKGSFGTGEYKVNYETPVKVRSNVIDVIFNRFFTLIITKQHELMITGEHYLSSPFQKTNKFTKIADNVRYATENFYITDNDELYAFGWAANGVTGLGDLKDKYEILPTKVMDDVESVASTQQATLILKKDGSLYGCGGDSPNYCGELGFGDRKPVFTPKFIMNNVKKVGMGTSYSAVLKNDGTLWMCGANNEWEVGL